MQSQKWQEKNISRGFLIRLIIAIAAVLLIGTAVILWIFIGGNGTTIAATIFTTLSVVLALLQWLLPLSSEPSVTSDQAYSLFLKQVEPKPSSEEGAIIIYTTPKLRSKQVEILDLQTQAQVALIQVNEYKVKELPIYAAIYRHLKPGNYIIQTTPQPSTSPANSTVITASPSTVSTIDWR